MALGKKRILIADDEEQHKKKAVKTVIHDGGIPEDLIMQSILPKASGRTLTVCSCVSKLWYNSIFNDTRFAASHFVHNQNKLSLVFNLLNVSKNNFEVVYFDSVEKDKKRFFGFFMSHSGKFPSKT